MPNPMKRHSKTRRNMRRSHDALSRPGKSVCPHCGEVKHPHHVCLSCGKYKGREVIRTDEVD